VLLKQAFYEMQTKKRFESAEKLDSEESQITTWLGTELPPVHIYRAPFETEDRDIIESDFSPEAWSELKSIAKEKKMRKMLEALKTAVDDTRSPLESVRRAWFERRVAEFDPNEHPDEIPHQFVEASCNILVTFVPCSLLRRV